MILPSVLLLFALGAGQANAMVAATDDSPLTGIDMPFLGGFLKETRIVYPLRVGDWKAQREHLYEEQEYGVSIRYQNETFKDRWIDLYFYPAGVLTETEFQQVAEETAAGVKMAATQRGDTEGFDMGKLVVLPIHIPSRERGAEAIVVPARIASLHMENEGKPYNSAMAIALHRLYFIKGRYSAEEASLSRDVVVKALKTFLTEVVRKSEISSSGGCWSQIPIVQKPAVLDQKGDTQMANTTGKEGSSAVLYQDRVETSDAVSYEAKILQHLGMAITGRFSAGCLPAEELNPIVPEDMREIRIEYRTRESNGTSGGSPGIRTPSAERG